jgi:hypothetical protein
MTTEGKIFKAEFTSLDSTNFSNELLTDKKVSADVVKYDEIIYEHEIDQKPSEEESNNDMNNVQKSFENQLLKMQNSINSTLTHKLKTLDRN